MISKPEVPAELRPTFERLLKRLPPEMRGDAYMQSTLLLYLKLGGETLARHTIELAQIKFRDRFFKKRIRDAAAIDAEDGEKEEEIQEESEDDVEDDNPEESETEDLS